MVTLILFVLIFGVVVISHEFGHFLLAKANGIHVIEFSVGMGPNLFSFQKGDTKYSLKLLPIGGACMFEGEDGLNEKEDGEDHSGSFLNANVWARISTVLAGPVFNFILGFVIAFIMVNLIATIRDPVAIRFTIINAITNPRMKLNTGPASTVDILAHTLAFKNDPL